MEKVLLAGGVDALCDIGGGECRWQACTERLEDFPEALPFESPTTQLGPCS